MQNRPGAGSRLLANVLYNVGPHDGTMMGLPNQGIAMDQALGADGVQFDARKFHWIGSTIEEVNVFWAWHTYPVRTIEDAKLHEFVAGATGPGSPTTFYPKIMNTLIGTKFKVVAGYPGSNELDLAIEKGEVGGRVVGWSSLKITGDLDGDRQGRRHAAIRPAQMRRICRMSACCRSSPATSATARSSTILTWCRRWGGRSSCRPARRPNAPQRSARRSSRP